MTLAEIKTAIKEGTNIFFQKTTHEVIYCENHKDYIINHIGENDRTPLIVNDRLFGKEADYFIGSTSAVIKEIQDIVTENKTFHNLKSALVYYHATKTVDIHHTKELADEYLFLCGDDGLHPAFINLEDLHKYDIKEHFQHHIKHLK